MPVVRLLAMSDPSNLDQPISWLTSAQRIPVGSNFGRSDQPYDRLVAIKPNASLASCVEFQIGVAVPAPLSGRLDTLVELANSAAANTNRKEVLAALLLAASTETEVLAELVRTYRTARIADAIVEGADRERFLRPEPSSPGPRPRRSE